MRVRTLEISKQGVGNAGIMPQKSEYTQVIVKGALHENASAGKAAGVQHFQHHAVAGRKMGLQGLGTLSHEGIHIFRRIHFVLQNNAVPYRVQDLTSLALRASR